MRKNLIVILLSFVLMNACTSAPKKTTPVSAAPAVPQKYSGDVSFHPQAIHPAFVSEHPKVCFDEAHHNLAVKKGFYQAVLGLIESDGFQVVRLQKQITPKILRGCKILYTSAALGFEDVGNKKLAARSAFSDDEIHAIVSWVHHGGSIIVMTDHQPMSESLSRLLWQFKIKGSILSVRNEQKTFIPFTDPGIFSIQNEQMNEKHPILQGRNEAERVKKVYWFYGQALQGPKDADAFLKIGAAGKIGGTNDEPVIPIEQFPAGALALKFKKGRVVVFGDATVFTSKVDLQLNVTTGINHLGSDNIQLALNVFHWLSGILP